MTHTPVPFLDLTAIHCRLEEELVDALRRALRSSCFIGGSEVEGFEQEFAEYCGTRYCVGVGNGTDAVRFALMAAGVGPGDAVVTVAHTFIATVEAISQAGATTEFVDIDERTCNMSPVALAAYLAQCPRDPISGRPLGLRTRKPIKAIVPVHLYGQVADIDALSAIAEEYGLLMVEDACQAHGAAYRSARGDRSWKRAGSFGTAAGFSFYPGKNLGACGEAGAVTTNDGDIARSIRMLRDHGQLQKYHHQIEGYNGRLDAVQAAFLRVKLRQLDAWNEQRRNAATVYSELLMPLSEVPLPTEPDNCRSVYHLYVVRHEARDAMADHLRSRGIATGLHYPVPLHLQSCYREWGYRPGSLPVTERAAREILSLPMFPGLEQPAQERVAVAIAEHLASRRSLGAPGMPATVATTDSVSIR